MGQMRILNWLLQLWRGLIETATALQRYDSQDEAFEAHHEGWCFRCNEDSCVTKSSVSDILYMECVHCGTIYDYDCSEVDGDDPDNQ